MVRILLCICTIFLIAASCNHSQDVTPNDTYRPGMGYIVGRYNLATGRASVATLVLKNLDNGDFYYCRFRPGQKKLHLTAVMPGNYTVEYYVVMPSKGQDKVRRRFTSPLHSFPSAFFISKGSCYYIGIFDMTVLGEGSRAEIKLDHENRFREAERIFRNDYSRYRNIPFKSVFE